MVDVSDLRHPGEVAFFHLDGAGTHNFWMDEAAQILYAAYYNGGVVALDVSGTLQRRSVEPPARPDPPGRRRNTYTWGVQLANGSLYAIDMLSGLWQIAVEPVEPLPLSWRWRRGRHQRLFSRRTSGYHAVRDRR